MHRLERRRRVLEYGGGRHVRRARPDPGALPRPRVRVHGVGPARPGAQERHPQVQPAQRRLAPVRESLARAARMGQGRLPVRLALRHARRPARFPHPRPWRRLRVDGARRRVRDSPFRRRGAHRRTPGRGPRRDHRLRLARRILRLLVHQGQFGEPRRAVPQALSRRVPVHPRHQHGYRGEGGPRGERPTPSSPPLPTHGTMARRSSSR